MPGKSRVEIEAGETSLFAKAQTLSDLPKLSHRVLAIMTGIAPIRPEHFVRISTQQEFQSLRERSRVRRLDNQKSIFGQQCNDESENQLRSGVQMLENLCHHDEPIRRQVRSPT